MKNFMKELKPQSLEDIIAGISLYRPGPMDFIPAYIKGKNHPEEVTYDCPQLEPILAPTYGCIVYQEQVMQIVQQLAGYTMGQADNIRRAMSKKKQYVIDAERQSFVYGDSERGIRGCVANGIDEKAANSIYDSMVDFAKYAFNKSHAAAYAVISVQTAWLKFYYPVEFMAALMTSVIDNSAKAAEYLLHCKELGISVLPPDINVGQGEFTAEGNAVRYGLYAIKSLGRPVIDSIIGERKKGGSYRTLQDFIERTVQRDINKRAIENLIKAGACDGLVGQPALANESLWWWILINLGVMVLLFGYGVKRGIQILRIFSIPKSKLTREPGVVVCDYNISLKKYALYKLWDIRHFSFSLLFIIYICIALCTGHYIVPEEQSLFSPLLIWFLCLIYILIMLPVRLNKIYKRSIAGQTWVEITPEGLTYDKAELKQTFPWEEIAGIALYKTYCFLYDKRGGEFLIVTSDEKVKESLLYYLNTKK